MSLHEALRDALAEIKILESVATDPHYQAAWAEIRYHTTSIQNELEWIKAELRSDLQPTESRTPPKESAHFLEQAAARLASLLSGDPDQPQQRKAAHRRGAKP